MFWLFEGFAGKYVSPRSMGHIPVVVVSSQLDVSKSDRLSGKKLSSDDSKMKHVLHKRVLIERFNLKQ